ncbi:MAG: hypothetical protein J5486_00420 [Bacteroidaceae bacterium]|nr:hypothetical protein [Bacteroidaceae bacterium]
MKKTYITPSVDTLDAIVESNILDNSLKISDTEVSGGWTKEEGDWDIWGEDEE